MQVAVGRLKNRPEFLRVAAARRKWVAPGLILQARASEHADDLPTCRVGFTATRKIGNAVVRNRARRRLRAAVQTVMPAHAKPGYDFVLIARGETARRPYPALLGDLSEALKRLDAYRDAAA